jgi:uncharacterized glyoxalase superfamily protein PhnB
LASGSGQNRTSRPGCGMSVSPPRADIQRPLRQLRFVPEVTFLLIFKPVRRGAENPMTEEHTMMVGAATVFVVSNIAKSIEHYREALGFTITFQYGNPTFYACLCLDEVALHLLAAHETKRLPGNGGICVFVKDVDRVYADLVSRGANVIKAPQDYDYGMRDFDVVDLDGNQLTFGMESVSSS